METENIMSEPFATIKEALGCGQCLLATVVEGKHAGEKLFFCNKSLLLGGVEGSFLAPHAETLRFVTDSSLLTLEGTPVFVEVFGETPRLVVCGAGTVGQALIAISSRTGFFVTALEDRPEYALAAQKLGAQEVICCPLEEALAKIPASPSTYFVVVTREHRYDTQCLRLIFEKEKAYVGMMGSRKRVALLKEQLAQQGVAPAQLEALQAPIGLSISAETPEEIAVSILAQLIQVKNSHRRTEGYPPALLEALKRGNCVLTQIVDRKGSTPRGIGTKMVVFPDGSHVGTVGGGWMEADVIRQAQQLFRSEQTTLLHRSEMVTGGESGSPMLCGGTQLIFMEKIK